METLFIAKDAPGFKEAMDICYDQLHKSAGLLREEVLNDFEETDQHCIAKEKDQVVGYGRLMLEEEGQGRVSLMAVHGDWHRKGVGSQILKALIDRAKELGLQKLRAGARVHVKEFYAGFGFKEVGEVFISTTTKIPHIWMEMEL